jgi:hypothetical protein
LPHGQGEAGLPTGVPFRVDWGIEDAPMMQSRSLPQFMQRFRALPMLGYWAIGPAALILGLLGLWIVFSGVAQVRGADLQPVFTLQKALRGLPIYTDPAVAPFDIVQYSPVYYLVVVGLAEALRIDPANGAGLASLARGVSFLCALALVAGFYRTSRRALELSRDAALVIAGLGFILTTPWFFLARPDAMATLFAMASLAAVAGARPASNRQIVASAGLAVLAIFTKQNEIQMAPVLFVFLVLTQGWRQAAVGAGAGLVFGALALGLCLLHWPHFLSNVIGGVENGVSFDYFIYKTLPNFLYPKAVLVGLAGFAVLSWARDRDDPRRMIFVVALPIFLLFALATGLKIGSAENYFNEFTLLALAAVAFLLSPLGRDRPGSGAETVTDLGAAGLAALAGLVLLVGLPFWTKYQLERYWWHAIEPSSSLILPRDALGGERYRILESRLDRAVLGDDGYVLAVPMSVNIAVNAPMLVPQKDVASQSYRRGIVNYGAFKRLMESGRIRYLIIDGIDTDNARLGSKFLGASLGGFVRQENVAGFTIFVWTGR